MNGPIDPAAELLQKKLTKARRLRSEIEPILDDCYRYALPGRRSFKDRSAIADMEDIYDHTGVVALDEFASLLHARVTPHHTNWVSLEANHRVPPEDREAINRDLAEICDYMFEEIHASNFGQEAQEAFLDMGCSLGAMIVEDLRSDLMHTALPMTQVYVEAGVRDHVGGLFREREVEARLIPAEYPDARIEGDLAKIIAREPDKPLTVTDGIWHVYKRGVAAHETVIVGVGQGQSVHTIRDRDHRGYGACPFIAFRWSKASGELWGRGPIMKVLPGIRSTNLVRELTLQNAAMALSGMWSYEDDGVINPDTIRIAPGVLIPKRPGGEGLRRIETGGREFQIGDFVSENERRDIRNATFSDALGDPNKTPFKATEVQARMMLHADRISANFGRIRSEMLQPYIRRVLWLLEKRKHIKLPVSIDAIRIEPQGPLARAIKSGRIRDVMSYVEMRQAMWGPQYGMATIHEGRTDAIMRDLLGVPPTVRTTVAEMTENMNRMTAMSQQAAAVTGAPQPAPITGP